MILVAMVQTRIIRIRIRIRIRNMIKIQHGAQKYKSKEIRR